MRVRARFVARAVALVMMLSAFASAAYADNRSQAKSQVDFGIKVAQNGLWKEATYRWEKAVEIDPTYAAAWNNLGTYEKETRHDRALAKKDFEKALEFYEQALKVRPEFPEAEFQKGGALVSLGRLSEAEAAFKRAIALKKNWSLPYSALGTLFIKQSREPEAEAMFRQALTIDPRDAIALRLLADQKLRNGATKEALDLARKATNSKDAPASSWVVLAMAERHRLVGAIAGVGELGREPIPDGEGGEGGESDGGDPGDQRNPVRPLREDLRQRTLPLP